MSRAELAQASGLREDLLARFIPAAETPNGPMYPAHQMALAVYVKELTDHNPATRRRRGKRSASSPPAPVAPAPVPTRSAGDHRGMLATLEVWLRRPSS